MIRHLWHRLTGLLTGRDLERDATRHQAAADRLDMAIRDLLTRNGNTGNSSS